MPDEARFVGFMAAAFLFFVALLQFTLRKRTMKPNIKTTIGSRVARRACLGRVCRSEFPIYPLACGEFFRSIIDCELTNGRSRHG
jgi:hypothetical protein